MSSCFSEFKRQKFTELQINVHVLDSLSVVVDSMFGCY